MKKSWFSDLDIQEIREEINRELRQDTNTIIDTPNTEKQEHSNRNEPQTNKNRNTTQPNHTEQTLTEEEEMNLENLKRNMYEQKTRLRSLRNQDWRTVKAETEKNKRIINTYLNERHYRIKRTNLCWSEISL